MALAILNLASQARFSPGQVVMTAGVDELVRQGRLDPTPLITHRLPLFRLAEAFRLLQVRPDGFLKAVVIPPRSEEQP